MGMFTKKHSIGKTIAELRKAKGWTQIELAEKLQVSDKAISKWEQDNGAPSIEFFPVLAELFSVTIDYLMTGKVAEKEVVTISKAELCAKNDDVALLNEVQADHKDENGKTLIDYIVQYNSEKVFVAFCELSKYNISKFSILDALKLCIVLNRLDLLKGANFILDRSVSFTFEDEYEILSLLVKEDEKNFQGAGGYQARKCCILTEEILKIIVCDERINEKTISVLLGNQSKRQCVWYHVLPFLIHQAYVNDEFLMLDRLLKVSKESNERGFSKYPKTVYHKHYYYVCGEYERNGHGFVRVLENTIKLALEKGDFDYLEEFNNLNKEVKVQYGFNAYVANEDEKRIAKLKHSGNVSPDVLSLQSAIHEGVVCIDEILATNNLNLIKKALSQYPIHTVERLIKLYTAQELRTLFEYAVDTENDNFAGSILRQDKRGILEYICRYASKNSINSKYLTLPAYNSYKEYEEYIKQISEVIEKCKQTVIEKVSAKLDKDAIIAELPKEFFEKELEKGNTDIVAIKLCVRLEAVLRSKGFEGTFEEMLNKYCSQLDYDDTDIPKRLNKLRMYRNSIVHSERNEKPLSVDELNACIDYICKMS